jgi:predicted nucleic acid-binding protein
LERWWTEARKRLRKEDRRGFDTFVLLIAWTLWKQRNARVFGNLERQLSTVQIIDMILQEFSLWRAARGLERRVMLRE